MLFNAKKENPVIKEGQPIKNGKKPTRRVKQIIKQKGLNPANWLVTKNLSTAVYIVHRQTGRERIIAI